MIVATPDDLQSALDSAARTDEFVRCKNGTEFTVEGVTVPAGVTVDARTAKFESGNSEVMFSFESGGLVLGGHIDISDTYSGVVFEIEAAGGEVVSGPTGPFGSLVYGQGTQAPCTGLRLEAHNGGTIDSVQTQYQTHHCSGVLDVVSKGSGIVRNCDVYAWGGQTDYFVRQRGNGEQTGNTWFGHNQPRKDVAEYQWYVTNPHAHDEWCEAYLWDSQKMARPWTVYVEEAGGNIKYANAQGRENSQDNRFHKFVDDSDSSGNGSISLNDLPNRQKAVSTLGFPSRRFECRRFYEAVDLIEGKREDQT